MANKITLLEAVDLILNEAGRGDRILVVDENLLDLEKELSALRYTVYPVPFNTSDEEIKRELRGRIFITRNGKDFAKDVEKFYYGLIWVHGNTDAKILAKEIEQVLMAANFARNPTQVVRI